MNADIAVAEVVTLEGVVQRVIDEHRLALASGNHHPTGLPLRHPGHHIAFEGGIGDEIHQNPVILIILRPVIYHRQILALHQRIPRASATGHIAFQQVVHGVHVVNAITQIRHHVIANLVVIRRLDINRIPGLANVISLNQRPGGIEQMNPVAPILGPKVCIPAYLVIPDNHIRRGIQPHPKGRPLKPVIRNNRPLRLPSHKNPRIQLIQILPPVTHHTTGKRHPLRQNLHRMPRPAGINHRIVSTGHRNAGHPDNQWRKLLGRKLERCAWLQGIQLILQVGTCGQRNQSD